jgi:two-component system, NarL family, invasion response regulator UvrY
MIRVLVVDDHSIVREGWRQLLDKTDNIRVKGEAADAGEAFDAVNKGRWDVVIVDLNLPDRSGIDLLKDIKRVHSKLPVLILSVHPEEEYGIRVLRAGAAGYLNKAAAPDELVTAVRKVCAGGRYISLAMAELLAFRLDEDAEASPHDVLSDREYQVMCMMAMGKAGVDIAAELNLSPKTISSFRTRILEKMNLKTNADIIRYALRNNLVE